MKTRLSLLGLMWSSFGALLPLDSCFVDQTALAGSLSYKCWVSDCVEMKNKVESDSTTSNIRRFTDSQLCHRPYPRLGGRKRDAFLIRWSTRDVAWILGPTASLVFNINWTWNRRDQHESRDIYIPQLWRHHTSHCSSAGREQMWVIVERKNYLCNLQMAGNQRFLTNYLIACCRQFICAAPCRRQQCVLVTVAWAIIPLAGRALRAAGKHGGGEGGPWGGAQTNKWQLAGELVWQLT